MRIGLFGGSFDPVHVGHLAVVEAATHGLALDRLILLPAGEQPYKAGRHHASAADRVAMLRAAVGEDPRVVVDDRETKRPGPSYTIDTIREIRSAHPDDALFLLVGADAALEFPGWRAAADVARLVTVVPLTRPGHPTPKDPMMSAPVTVPSMDVSSTVIRAHAARGEQLDGLVPPPVARFIGERRLYREEDAC